MSSRSCEERSGERETKWEKESEDVTIVQNAESTSRLTTLRWLRSFVKWFRSYNRSSIALVTDLKVVTSDFLPNFNVLSNYKLFTFIFKGRRNEREKEKASCFSPCFRMTDVVPAPQKKRKTSRRRRVQGQLCFSVRSKAEDTDGERRTRLRPNGISIQKTTEQVLFSV